MVGSQRERSCVNGTFLSENYSQVNLDSSSATTMLPRKQVESAKDQLSNALFLCQAPHLHKATTPEHSSQGDGEDIEFIAPEKPVVEQCDGELSLTSKADRKSESPEESTHPLSTGTRVDVPARYTLSLLAFLACFTLYSLRSCLSIALAAMVNSTALHDDHHNISNDISNDCAGAVETNNVTTEDVGEFVWDEKTQGFILGAVYYGNTLPQLFAGWLASKVQGKRILGCSVLASSLLSFAIPSAARAGSSCLIAIRVLQGVAESFPYPAIHVLCSKWVPVHERSRLVAFVYSGCEMGAVCGMLLTGLLCRYGFAGGWPSAFYVFGILGCVWFVMWMLLVYESPALHPRISDRERRYIESSLGDTDRKRGPIPWREMLTSAPVWGVCIAHFSYNWGYYSFISCLPVFMKEILHFKIVANGFLSALPYLLMWLTQVLAGIVSDLLRQYLSTAFTRKLMLMIGSVIPASLLIGTGYVDCDHTLAVVLLTTGVSAKGIAASAVLVNHLDFAPKFAGTLFALSNAIAATPGFLGPSVVGLLTYQNQTAAQWRKFFFITAAIYIGNALTFLWLGRGEVQAWAAPAPQSTSLPAPLLQKETQVEEEKLQM